MWSLRTTVAVARWQEASKLANNLYSGSLTPPLSENTSRLQMCTDLIPWEH